MSKKQNHTAWLFKNLTNAPLVLTKIMIKRVIQNITLLPNEERKIYGWDRRFIQLDGNFYEKFAQTLPSPVFDPINLIVVPIALRTTASAGPSPVPNLIRVSGLALSVAERTAINNSVGAGAVPNVIVSNCETEQYTGPFVGKLAAVDVAGGDWVDLVGDNLLPFPVEPNAGAVHIQIGITSAQDVNGNALPIEMNLTPVKDPSEKENTSSSHDYVDDTWQHLTRMSKGRHSSTIRKLSDGRIYLSHGSEHPFCEPYASQNTELFDPVTKRITQGPLSVVAGFDRGFTHGSVLCPDGKHRALVGGGFPSNDEILNGTVQVEAFTEEDNKWDAATALYYDGPIAIPAGPLDANGNVRVPWGPYVGPPLPAGAPVQMIPFTGGGPAQPVGEPIQPPDVYPGDFFGNPAGQYSWTTASFGHFPGGGFDFGLLFTESLTQRPNGLAAGPLASGQFAVDPALGEWIFSAADVGRKVMTITPWRIFAPTPSRPDHLKSFHTLLVGFHIYPDGEVIMIGGIGSRSHPGFLTAVAQAVPERWSPATGLWADAAPMPIPVASEPPNSLLHSDGNVYVFGGLTLPFVLPFQVLSGATQAYNRTLDAWSVLAPFPEPGAGIARPCQPVELPDGGILIAGGFQAVGPVPSGSLPPASPRSYIYYPPSHPTKPNTWERVGDMPVAICGGWSSKLADGRIVQIGSTTHGNVQAERGITKAVQVFDPHSKLWTRMQDIAEGIPNHWYRTETLDDGKIIVMGGITALDRNELFGEPSRNVALYCPPRL